MPPPCVRREIVLPDSAEGVWEALTDPVRLAEWFANEVELELRPGGEGTFRWDDGSVRRARVEDVEPGRRLSFLWRDESADEAPTRVELTLEEVAEGTRLEVVESAALVPGTRASARALIGEWSWALAMLALALVLVAG